jgi:cell division septation protein DedD
MSRERTTGIRKSPAAGDAGKGVAGLAAAWKVAVFLPLVLTGAVLAGRVDLGSDGPDTTPSASQQIVNDRTPSALETDATDTSDKGDRKQGKRDRQRASDSPTSATSDPTTSSPSASPDPDPTTPQPTKSPTKSPTKGPSPSPTPTPDEAEDMCREEGVNPLDLAAMAACVAEMLGRD